MVFHHKKWGFLFIYCRIYFVQSGPFCVLCGKSTPAGKKYTSAAGDACDKLQLWHGWFYICSPSFDNICKALSASKSFPPFQTQCLRRQRSNDCAPSECSCQWRHKGADSDHSQSPQHTVIIPPYLVACPPFPANQPTIQPTNQPTNQPNNHQPDNLSVSNQPTMGLVQFGTGLSPKLVHINISRISR